PLVLSPLRGRDCHFATRSSSFCFLLRRPARSPLFPYTTLFRSVGLLVVPSGCGRVGVRRRTRPHAPAQNAQPRTGADRPGSHRRDRKSTRLNSSHVKISYAVFCLKKKTRHQAESRSQCPISTPP